jgi:hypothetical protein
MENFPESGSQIDGVKAEISPSHCDEKRPPPRVDCQSVCLGTWRIHSFMFDTSVDLLVPSLNDWNAASR